MAKTEAKKTIFNEMAKRALQPGQEITDGDIIWRKRKDGSGTWRYDFRLHGQRYKGVLGTEKTGCTLGQARDKFRRIQATAICDPPARVGRSSAQNKVAFEDAADEFLSWSEFNQQDYRHNKNRMQGHVLPYFSGRTLESITVSDVETFRTSLSKKGLSSATIKRIISLLSNVFVHSGQKDPALLNPTRGLRRLRTTPDHIEEFPDDGLALLLDPDNNPSVAERTMVALARYSGLRASEVLGLEWKHVDFQRKVIEIRQSVVEGKVQKTTKSGKSRYVPMPKPLEALLKELLKMAGTSSWLFPGKHDDHPMHQVQHVFRRMRIRSGLPDAPGFHSLRHRFASAALEKNVTIHMVKDWMGHSSIRMTEKYVHLTDAHRYNMMQLIR